MAYDPRLHHRRSIRLRGYDYAGGGAYFVTICTRAKKCLFGEIVEGSMILNEAGNLVQRIWHTLPQRFGSLVLDAFQMMPNHLHAIFVLPGPGLEPALAVATGAPIIQPSATRRGRACPTLLGSAEMCNEGTASRPPTGRRTSMGDVVGAFKSISTIAINKLMSRPGARPLHENFYEHIIRGAGELEMIRDYIVHNPQRWLEDPENPNMP
ncbi:MAG TPA: transposase [Terriglobia bacterium]|nr:transposase [Terriglobia bacterium]